MSMVIKVIPYVRHALPVVVAFFLVGCGDPFIRYDEPGKWLMSHWLSFLVNTFSTALLFSSLLFLLGRFACYGVTLLLGGLVGLELVELFLRNNFKSEMATGGGEWLMVLSTSSWSEVVEFFKIYFGTGSCLLVLAVVLVLVGVGWHIRREDGVLRHDWHFRLTGLVLTLPFVVVCQFCGFEHNGLCDAVMSHDFWQGGQPKSFFKDIGAAVYAPNLPAQIRSKLPRGMCPVGVVVIGESATRNHWSLYGYKRCTCPRMEAIVEELCVFEDVISATTLTPTALRFILTDAEVDQNENSHYTLPGVLKRAGCRCVLISGQDHWGYVDGTDSILFHDCEKRLFLSDIYRKKRYYDDAILPLLDEELLSSDGCPLVIFLHLMGSHFDPANRYPKENAPFPGEGLRDTINLIDHYDNSIHFTDKLLGCVYDRLNALGRPAFLFYVSDHGESTRFGIPRDADDPDVWEIPMLVWWSPQYRKLFPETIKKTMSTRKLPLQEDKIFQLLLDLIQIERWPGAMHSPFPPDIKERRIKNGHVIYEPKKRE